MHRKFEINNSALLCASLCSRQLFPGWRNADGRNADGRSADRRSADRRSEVDTPLLA